MRVSTTISATIYTDGSCDTKFLIGAWVAILLIGDKKKQLNGVVKNTTHNRMELTAVITAMEYIRDHHTDVSAITICSDSQYVLSFQSRRERLTAQEFITRKGKALPNSDLVKRFLGLLDSYTIEQVKLKAHQKKDENNEYNIEADLLSRQLVRASVKEHFI